MPARTKPAQRRVGPATVKDILTQIVEAGNFERLEVRAQAVLARITERASKDAASLQALVRLMQENFVAYLKTLLLT